MNLKRKKVFDSVVIGGGFYGCIVSLYLKKFSNSVCIVEKESDLLKRASYINQARVHNGYHYPRSFITALRSHRNYTKFIKEFKKSIFSGFKQYYAIASNFSKTTSRQFVKFCKQIGSPVKGAPEFVRKLFNERLVEDVFEVDECVFDATLLRKMLKQGLREAGIKVFLEEEVVLVKKLEDKIAVFLKNGETLLAKKVFNCTYSNINRILDASKLPTLPLKHEFIEMPLIRLPNEIRDIGVTILDGPFFGFLPFPVRSAHSLWHVRYAVHSNWTDHGDLKDREKSNIRIPKSRYLYMIKDAQRFMPILGESKYLESLYEVKTVLIDREISDGRPIIYKKDWGIPNFNIVMGGKVDNVYDALHELHKDVKV